MKKLLFCSLAILGLSHVSSAQFDVGLQLMPSASSIHGRQKFMSNFYTFPLNGGLSANYTWKRFSFSTGILHLTQGERFEVMETDLNNPDGNGNFYDVFLRAKAIVVPLRADYHFYQKNKTSIFGGIGLYTGLIYSQEQENTNIPKDGPNPFFPLTRFMEVDAFDPLYFGFNIGVGLNQQLNEQFSFQVRPNFLYQIRKELPADKYAWTNRLMTWSLDLGFYYRLRS